MAEQFGIEQTIDVFELGQEIVSGVKAAKENDGKVDLKTEFVHFLNIPVKLFNAIVGADQIPKEITDLSDQEILQLKDHFGDIVDSPKWQRLFFHLVSVADAVAELTKKEDTES